LGLYRRADKLLHLRYECQKQRLGWGISVESLSARNIVEWGWVEKLLTPIDQVSLYSVWMKKTAEYWGWRYGERPAIAYQIIRIKRFGKIIGAAVLKEVEDGMEIIDIAFLDAHHFQTTLYGVAHWLSSSKNRILSVWGSEQAIRSMESVLGGDVSDVGYITLPGEILGASMSEAVLERLWLLGGDTDYR
jgi:hypothetical protein